MTRAQIQDELAMVVSHATATMNVPNDAEHRRRVCRALIHIAIAHMVNGGDEPETVRKALEEAFVHEMQARKIAVE